ncbi:hypothetical protein [Tahibacter amnicola]|uniref:Uncharacterized protein n=1 Tax=Tahibacter amnicola TaxID=2976241 RepID=A0ABY6BBR0_9GAMM|nr:hypothetical protein [Tahibacter amnicola]UXI67247.1 hypothetical protein N4264_21280 [Tahibacter amnicola]
MKPLVFGRLMPWSSLALAAPFAAMFAPIAVAQNYETHYGEVPTYDSGQDVKAVNFCPNSGNIVVGTRRAANATEVLATRTNNTGIAMWQRAYRIGGSVNSSANAVVELRDGSGFVLTGSVSMNETMMYAMRIRCDGSVMWTRLLGNQAVGNRAVGYDVIETANPTAPAALGELVVVGDEAIAASAGVTHGRIVRLNAGGGMIWNFAYTLPTQNPGLRFRAVTENKSAVSALPDIIVAGSSAGSANWASDRRGLMFRVRSTGAPLCNSVMGNFDTNNEDYFGITALRVGNFANESVLVGSSAPNTGGNATNIYLTRFQSGGCAPIVQSIWRDPQDGSSAADVVESLVTTGLPGSILATGTIRGTVTAGDGFLLSAAPANLGPNAQPFRFSTQSAKAENLSAIDLKGNRYVLAGTTFTDWQAVSDPQDFYLVQTDPNRRTQCAVPWQFAWWPISLPREQFTPPVKVVQAASYVGTPIIQTTGEGYCCQLNPL